ncbi:porin family protein [Myxococcota bacterium]|nr:porin family protein [Myxococcota bacterium]
MIRKTGIVVFLLSMIAFSATATATPFEVSGSLGVGGCQGSCGGIDPGAQLRIGGQWNPYGGLGVGLSFSSQWLGGESMEGLYIRREGAEVSWTFWPHPRFSLRAGLEFGAAQTGFDVTTTGNGVESVSENGTYGGISFRVGYRLIPHLTVFLETGYVYHLWGERNDNDFNSYYIVGGVSWSFDKQ